MPAIYSRQSFLWSASLNWCLLHCCIVRIWASAFRHLFLKLPEWQMPLYRFIIKNVSTSNGSFEEVFRKPVRIWDNCSDYRRDASFGSFDQAIISFTPLCVLLELCCLPTVKASWWKGWEDDWQDSVSNYSQRMTICFILSLRLSFWGLPRPVL